MGEYYSAEIHIGGTVERSKLKELVLVLRKSAVQDLDESDLATNEIAQLLLSPEDAPVHFRDNQAKSGQFEEIESYCRTMGISYDRYSDSHYELDAECSYWRPGFDEPRTFVTDSAGEHYVPLRDVKDLLVKEREPGVMLEAALAIYIAENEKPPLPPFKVVDSTTVKAIESKPRLGHIVVTDGSGVISIRSMSSENWEKLFLEACERHIANYDDYSEAERQVLLLEGVCSQNGDTVSAIWLDPDGNYDTDNV